MPKPAIGTVITWLMLALTPSAWAGDADPFAALHDRLSQAAEQSLARLQAEPREATAPVAETRSIATEVDEPLAEFAQRYWKGRETELRRALQRVEAQRVAIDPILRTEGVPLELTSVVLVESAGNVAALSPAGARGLWQFMPDTARRYGLEVGTGSDDRLDVEKATRAAARHLRDLHDRFGSWELALAAYNAGARAVERAIQRAGSNEFALLAANRLLPAETRDYVPAVLAAADLLGDGAVLRHAPVGRPKPSGVLFASFALAD